METVTSMSSLIITYVSLSRFNIAATVTFTACYTLFYWDQAKQNIKEVIRHNITPSDR